MPDQKIDPALFAATSAGGRPTFIVILAAEADLSGAARLATKKEKGEYVFAALRRAARRSQAPLLRRLTAMGVSYRAHYIANSIIVRGDRGLLEELASDPLVDEIDSDSRIEVISPAAMRPAPGPGLQWNIRWIGANAAWAMGFSGQGAVVAVVDTGVDWQHLALEGQYRGWDAGHADHNFNWWDAVRRQTGPNPSSCGYALRAPCDDTGHGTHTTGIAVGSGGIGVAPGARWIACRSLSDGTGTQSQALDCLEWALAPWNLDRRHPNPDLAPDIVNASWGCPVGPGCRLRSLRAAVGNLRAAGIMFAAAAGNTGPDCSTVVLPGLYAAATTVGATDFKSNTVASFSALGPVTVGGQTRTKPDIAAPGVDILSSVPSGGYASGNGTSDSAPHVAGAAALAISACPYLSGHVGALDNILFATARHLPSRTCGGKALPNDASGWGVVDADAAARRASLNCSPLAASAAAH